jgi:hypothetical protein
MTTSLQFQAPSVPASWASSRETHMAVATAIHALAGAARSPDQIWEDPTATEFDTVKMAVQNYVDAGVFPAEDDGRYAWGQETIDLAA